ncbi:MAG: glycosyl hydrolase, partial [Acidobacteriota bacterium]
RYDRRTKQVRDISPNPETHYGWGAADINFRFWWTFPVMVSPHDAKTLYVTSQVVHRTRNEGQSWEVISPDLTRADPKTLEKTPSYLNPSPGEFWGPITREAYGPEWYATIFAFAESPKQAGVLWAGSDDGFVHVSRDNGTSWTKVTPPGLPEFALVSIIDPSPHDAGTAYVAATRYKLQDNRPYLYKTSDYGKTWTTIVDGIPATDFTRVIREDPGRKGLLYAGTETGVYVSFDDGGRWQPLQLNLPVVPVHDLVIKNGDLIAATHGRSFWILDNVALLQQLTPSVMTDAVRLFEPRTTVRYGRGASLAGTAATAPNIDGANPPAGVVVPFYFKTAPTAPVTLTISKDGSGPGAGAVRTVTFDPPGAAPGGPRRPVARAGANNYVWDMRYPASTVLAGAVFQGRAVGPVAPPGTYTFELSASDVQARTTTTIVKDPRLTYTDADLENQFTFLIDVRDQLTDTMSVVKRVRDTRAEAEELVKKAKETRRGRTPESQALLDKAMTDLNNRLYTIEERLVQFRARAGQDLIANPTGIDSKLAQLLGFASMGDGPPTDGSKDLLKRLTDGIAERKTALDGVDKKELATLKRLTTTLSK